MSKGQETPDNTGLSSGGYGKYAYQWIISDKINVMRARLLNLADSITSDAEQRKAIKGLIKDFCGDAYYPMINELENYLEYFKVLESGSRNMPPRLQDTRLES